MTGVQTCALPIYPGVNSAFGMLSADVRLDFAMTCRHELNNECLAPMNNILGELAQRGRTKLAAEGFPGDQITIARAADLRYQGQSYELTMPLPGGLLGSGDMVTLNQIFHRTHGKEYGYSRDGDRVELINLRVVANGKLPHFSITPPDRNKVGISKKAEVQVYYNQKPLTTQLLPRSAVHPGKHIAGPALIYQEDTTTLLWPNCRATGDSWGNLVIEVGAD